MTVFYVRNEQTPEQTLCAFVAYGSKRVFTTSFLWRGLNIHPSHWCAYSAQFCLLHGMLPREAAAVSALPVWTIQPRTSLQCQFIGSHVGLVHACIAVTCHLRFWQNDRDLLRATR